MFLAFSMNVFVQYYGRIFRLAKWIDRFCDIILHFSFFIIPLNVPS